MEDVKGRLRRINKQRRMQMALDKDSCCFSAQIGQNSDVDQSDFKTLSRRIDGKTDLSSAKVPSNNMISGTFWRLNSWRNRETVFKNLEVLYLLLLDADGSIENARRIMDEIKKYENFGDPCPVSKVRLGQALKKVDPPISNLTWDEIFQCLQYCESNFKTKSDVFCDEDYARKIVQDFTKSKIEVAKSVNNLLATLKMLRETLKNIDKLNSNDEFVIPDIENAFECLSRSLQSLKTEEEDLNNFKLCSTWIVKEAKDVLSLIDGMLQIKSSEILSPCKSSEESVVKARVSCKQETSNNYETPKNTFEEDLNNNMKVEKLGIDKIKPSGAPLCIHGDKVNTEDEGAKGLESVDPSVSPPVATSTPRNSFSAPGSSSSTNRHDEDRYPISSLFDVIASGDYGLMITDKFKMLLDLLDDGSGTVSSSLMDQIMSSCPHLFQ